MSDNVGTGEDEPKKTSVDQVMKKTREKSVKYPYYSLKDCVDYLSIIHEIGGKKEAPIEAVLSRLNLTVPSSRRFTYLTSSAENFGLIEKSKQGIKPTENGTLIIYPPFGDEQKKNLLIEAFKTPIIYQKIIERYNQMILPNKDLLKNIFYSLGIARIVLDQAVESFLESALYVNVLDSNNRLIVPIEGEDQIGQQTSSQTPSQTNNQYPPQIRLPESKTEAINQCQSDLQQISDTRPLTNKDIEYHKIDFVTLTGKKASILLPSDVTKSDIEKIKGLLNVFTSE